MDEKILEALNALKTSFDTFVTESKAASDKVAKAEADANADKDAVAEALEAYDKAAKAIEDAKLLPSQAEALRAAAKRGEDVTPLIESAKKIVEEAKRTLSESGSVLNGQFTGAGSDATDFTIVGLR